MADADTKKLWKEFRAFTDYVDGYLTMLDQAMKEPESFERGKRLANLANELGLRNDMVRRFTLNLDFNGRPLRQGPPARRAAPKPGETSGLDRGRELGQRVKVLQERNR